MRPRSVPVLPLLALLLSACTSSGRYLASGPGTSAPAIPPILAYDQYGKAVNLRTATSSPPWTVVFFYPKANTPG